MAVATQDDWRGLARRYARKYNFPEDVFERQMGQEAHGQDVSSPAGAQGPAQIMPDTARAWGLSPSDVHNINKAYDAAARNMAGYVKKYGSVRNALIAYNAGPGAIGRKLPAETQQYLRIILSGGGATGSAPRSSGGAVASAASVGAGIPGSPEAAPGSGGNDRLATLAGVMQRLQAATPNIPYNSPLSQTDDAPTTGTDPTQFMGAPQSSLGQPTSTFQPTQVQSIQPPNVGDLLASIAATRGTSAPTSPGAPSSGGSQGGSLVGGSGDFNITGPNPKRIQAPVVSFMRRVADVYGHPITASDGSGHSRLTTTGNVSEHTTGMAVDNPARGKALVAMGQAALIAAGMPVAQARKQTGGLYNVYGKDGTRYQIIFNIDDPARGGNHLDHLHVGVKPGARRR